MGGPRESRLEFFSVFLVPQDLGLAIHHPEGVRWATRPDTTACYADTPCEEQSFHGHVANQHYLRATDPAGNGCNTVSSGVRTA